MISATRKIWFCAGHRVMGHENKCAHFHGHNYVVYLEAVAEGLDDVGRVIDFSVLKERVGTWVDEHWDHRFLAYRRDQHVRAVQEASEAMQVFWLPLNPTAENIALYLLEIVCPLVLDGTGVKVRRVRVWETENCYADAVAD